MGISFKHEVIVVTITVVLVSSFLILFLSGSSTPEPLEEQEILLPESTDDVIYNLPVIDTFQQPTFHTKFNNITDVHYIPSVICPGTMKSGTTFLYELLTRHPNISKSFIRKEVNFFTKMNYNEGVQSYMRNFVNNGSLVIDFSPKYMMLLESPELIYETNRHMKFVVTLRNPIDRAYSHFRYQEKIFNKKSSFPITDSSCKIENITLSFKHYLTEELSLLHHCGLTPWFSDKPDWSDYYFLPGGCEIWSCANSNSPCLNCFRSTTSLSSGYLYHGLYAHHIQRFLNYFPLKNFYFIEFEEMIANPSKILNEIVEWLELPPISSNEWGDFSPVNTGDYPPMEKDEEEFLRNFYKVPNEQLFDLLEKRKFSWK